MAVGDRAASSLDADVEIELEGPMPRDRRNEPGFLPTVAAAVARARGDGVADLDHTTRTALAFFGIAG